MAVTAAEIDGFEVVEEATERELRDIVEAEGFDHPGLLGVVAGAVGQPAAALEIGARCVSEGTDHSRVRISHDFEQVVGPVEHVRGCGGVVPVEDIAAVPVNPGVVLDGLLEQAHLAQEHLHGDGAAGLRGEVHGGLAPGVEQHPGHLALADLVEFEIALEIGLGTASVGPGIVGHHR